MGELYGLFGARDQIELKIFELTAEVQEVMEDHFPLFEEQFNDGIDDLIAFDGGYSPDDNQMVFMPATDQMNDLVGQLENGPAGIESFDREADSMLDVRALIWRYQDGQVTKILIQNFTRAQAVSRRGKLLSLSDGNTFDQVTHDAFVVENKIHAIIANNRMYFKRFYTVKRIFDLEDVYREATDEDVQNFAGNENIAIEDIDNFIDGLNSVQRKLIFSLQKSEIFENLNAEEIGERAAQLDIEVDIDEGAMVLPTGKDLTNLLKFMDRSVYRSVIDNQRYVANSRRRLG